MAARASVSVLKVARDDQLRVDRGYKHRETIVWEDGREKLVGIDWQKRRYELLVRSKGKCERTAILGKPHAERCSGAAEEAHHIISRWKCRDDRIQNLCALSAACHRAEDKRQPKWSKP